MQLLNSVLALFLSPLTQTILILVLLAASITSSAFLFKLRKRVLSIEKVASVRDFLKNAKKK